MLVLKPHLCAWFFYAWTQLNERKTMICKGWEKISLLQSFNLDFQMETYGVNATKTLFSSNFTQEIDICDPIDLDDNDLDLKENTRTIMQQCLEKVLKVLVSKPTPSDIKNIFKLKVLVKNN
jgi:hypothetical protein